jgi:hypothetical protein
LNILPFHSVEFWRTIGKSPRGGILNIVLEELPETLSFANLGEQLAMDNCTDA